MERVDGSLPSRSISYSCAMDKISSPSLTSTVLIWVPFESLKWTLNLAKTNAFEPWYILERPQRRTHPVPGSGRCIPPCITTVYSKRNMKGKSIRVEGVTKGSTVSLALVSLAHTTYRQMSRNCVIALHPVCLGHHYPLRQRRSEMPKMIDKTALIDVESTLVARGFLAMMTLLDHEESSRVARQKLFESPCMLT